MVNKFAMIPKCFYGVLPSIKGRKTPLVYMVLCDCAGNKTRKCWPSRDYILKAAGMHKDTVSDSITELAGLGLIEVKYNGHNGKENLYTILDEVKTLTPYVPIDVKPDRSGGEVVEVKVSAPRKEKMLTPQRTILTELDSCNYTKELITNTVDGITKKDEPTLNASVVAKVGLGASHLQSIEDSIRSHPDGYASQEQYDKAPRWSYKEDGIWKHTNQDARIGKVFWKTVELQQYADTLLAR